MFSRCLLRVALVLALGGCGCSRFPAVAPANAPPPAAVMVQPSSAPQGQVPSQKLLGRWTAPTSPDAIGYADFGALFSQELIRGLVSAGLFAAKDFATKDNIDCVAEWLSSVREVAGFVKAQEGLLILTYEPTALRTPLEHCMQSFGDPPRVEMGPKLQAYALKDAMLVIEPDVVLLGRRQLVEASLSRQSMGSWPPAFGLEKDQQITFLGRDDDKGMGIKGYLSVAAEQFVVHVDITYPDTATAKTAAELMSPERVKRELSGQNPQVQAVSDLINETWHVQQAGQHVGFEFGIRGKSTLIAERLGMVSALAVYGVRKYIAGAKTTEARATVAIITKDLAVAHPTKFTSLPPVPAKFEAVQGKQYQSAPADWAKWKSIGFSRNEPQYYQYRVEAAKNGKSAVVIAEGDLDGNGKKSRFALSVQLDGKTGQILIEPELKVQELE
jgi:type IV pilus assembly protein PilA